MSIREYISLVEALNNSGPIGELEAALSLWVEGEMSRAAPEMERLAPIAKKYAHCSASYLYRGFVFRQKDITENGLIIHTDPRRPFASWSTSKKAVSDFMFGWDDPWVMITKPTSELDIYINLVEFHHAEKPFTKMAGQQEVIIRMPPTMALRPEEFKVIDWRKNPRDEVYHDEGDEEGDDELNEWIESYENGKIVLRTESGQLPDFLYRFMSPKEYALAVKRGAFYPQPGQRIHASERPEKRYSEHDSVLVRFKFYEEDGWRPKWGGDTLYAVTDGPVPFDHGELLKD